MVAKYKTSTAPSSLIVESNSPDTSTPSTPSLSPPSTQTRRTRSGSPSARARSNLSTGGTNTLSSSLRITEQNQGSSLRNDTTDSLRMDHSSSHQNIGIPTTPRRPASTAMSNQASLLNSIIRTRRTIAMEQQQQQQSESHYPVMFEDEQEDGEVSVSLGSSAQTKNSGSSL